jgi:hypothetical protein
MTPIAFRRSIAKQRPPAALPAALAALWWAKKGNWAKAHNIVMSDDGADCAWVHAYLHRVEGDEENARYWYRQARRPPAAGPCAAEWNALVSSLLSRNGGPRAQ